MWVDDVLNGKDSIGEYAVILSCLDISLIHDCAIYGHPDPGSIKLTKRSFREALLATAWTTIPAPDFKFASTEAMQQEYIHAANKMAVNFATEYGQGLFQWHFYRGLGNPEMMGRLIGHDVVDDLATVGSIDPPQAEPEAVPTPKKKFVFDEFIPE
jgi:hypothetical protein